MTTDKRSLLFEGRTFDDAPSLVLLNLKLPKVSGLDVLRAIKSDPRTLAIPVYWFDTNVEPPPDAFRDESQP